MQVLPISADARETVSTDADEDVARRRALRWKRPDLLFLAVVVAPVLASILYFGFLASDIYISESRFVVRAPEKRSTTGLGAILQTAGFTNASDEVSAAQSYAVSRDALQAINKNGAFEKAYSAPEI